jgi:hypothetical protein
MQKYLTCKFIVENRFGKPSTISLLVELQPFPIHCHRHLRWKGLMSSLRLLDIQDIAFARNRISLLFPLRLL